MSKINVASMPFKNHIKIFAQSSGELPVGGSTYHSP